MLAVVCVLQLTGINEMAGWMDTARPWLPFVVVVALFSTTWLVARGLRERARRIALLVGSCACAVAFDPVFAAGSVLWLLGFHRALFARGRTHPGWGLAYALTTLLVLAVACSRDLWPEFLDAHRELSRLGFLWAIAYVFRIAWVLHEVRMRREVLPLLDFILYFVFAPLFVIIPHMLVIPRCDRFRAGLPRHDLGVERAGVRLVAWGCVLAVGAWVLREVYDPKTLTLAALHAHDTLRVALLGLPYYPLQPALEVCASAAILVGLVRIAGIDLGVSFDRPLTAQTLGEFWRRWNTHFRDLLVELFYVPTVLRMRRRRTRGIVLGCFMVFVVGSTLLHLPKHYFRNGSVIPLDVHILVENLLMFAIVAIELVREQTRPFVPATSPIRAALRMVRTWTILLVVVIYAGYGSQYALFGERIPVATQPWR